MTTNPQRDGWTWFETGGYWHRGRYSAKPQSRPGTQRQRYELWEHGTALGAGLTWDMVLHLADRRKDMDRRQR